ncbi:MAG TPA: hypothetical protein P5519_09795 [Spirochaetia bacterium]|nr:hypothetical protein [Spirochaetia bacterium]
MNVNPIIISALSSLNLPVTANVYEGTADEYITFNYADERPALRADDTDLYDETTVQVHYFTRGNPQPNKKAIRRLLRASGFTIISTSEFYESDTKLQHIVVEAWIDGVIND